MQRDLMRGPLHWYHGTDLLFVHDGPSLFALCHGRDLQISHSQESSFHDYSDFYLALSNSCFDNPHLTVAHLSLRSCMGVATLVARVDVMNSEIHAHRRHTQYPDTTSPFWFVDNNLPHRWHASNGSSTMPSWTTHCAVRTRMQREVMREQLQRN